MSLKLLGGYLCIELFVNNIRFKEADSFVGYQKDTAASIILHATQLIEDKKLVIESADDEDELSFEEKVIFVRLY